LHATSKSPAHSERSAMRQACLKTAGDGLWQFGAWADFSEMSVISVWAPRYASTRVDMSLQCTHRRMSTDSSGSLISGRPECDARRLALE